MLSKRTMMSYALYLLVLILMSLGFYWWASLILLRACPDNWRDVDTISDWSTICHRLDWRQRVIDD